jgi:hypothetical protein
MRRVSVRCGIAVLVLVAVCLVPFAAFADEAKIGVPPASPAPSAQAEIQIPIGFWDAVLIVWLAARIGPPIG